MSPFSMLLYIDIILHLPSSYCPDLLFSYVIVYCIIYYWLLITDMTVCTYRQAV